MPLNAWEKAQKVAKILQSRDGWADVCTPPRRGNTPRPCGSSLTFFLNEAFNRMCENKYVMGLRRVCCVQLSKRPHAAKCHVQLEEREHKTCFELPEYFLVENEIVTRGEGGGD